MTASENAPRPPTARRERCSDAARERGDPLIGTAPPATRWLLIEQDGGWGREALTSLDAPASVRSHLERCLSESGARLQLIRRPGRKSREMAAAPMRWFVVDIGTGGRDRGRQGTIDDGWEPVFAALLEPAGDSTAPHSTDATSSDPRTSMRSRFVLVCTNGRHDMCCAVRGRPVAAALAERWPADVWECTHTGGDRFAGNVVVLPDGVVYGGLDPDSAIDVLEDHESGGHDSPRIAKHLRGYVGFRSVEQAARAALAPLFSEAGLMPWDRIRVAATSSRDGDAWICSLTLDGQQFATVTGHDEIRPAQHLTCSATAVSRARVPVAEEVRRADPAT